MSKDKRIDAYIEKSADFAQPILEHLRTLVHAACPNVEETIKWGFPHFVYSGEILCSMAAFKAHCTFGFWKTSIMSDPHKILTTIGKTAMGHLGQIKHVADLPPNNILKQYIKEAALLNKQGIKISKPKPATPSTKTIQVPDYFLKAIAKNKKALKTFDSFSYTNKKDYVEWITDAKTDVTREKRVKTAVEWLAEGKIRNWKYTK